MILQLNPELKHSFFYFFLIKKVLCLDNRYKEFWKKVFFNHFHKPHFQDFQVHDQDLSCWLYAQPRKQAQENCQTYTLKDNLTFNDRIFLNILP